MQELEELDVMYKEAVAASKKLRWRRDNPYVADLIEILRPHPNGLRKADIDRAIRQLRSSKNLPIPSSLGKVVQSFLQRHASGYAGFETWNSTSADDLFFPVPRKGAGKWAVNMSRATAWLIAKNKLQ
jgi:hypothetical protein